MNYHFARPSAHLAFPMPRRQCKRFGFQQGPDWLRIAGNSPTQQRVHVRTKSRMGRMLVQQREQVRPPRNLAFPFEIMLRRLDDCRVVALAETGLAGIALAKRVANEGRQIPGENPPLMPAATLVLIHLRESRLGAAFPGQAKASTPLRPRGCGMGWVCACCTASVAVDSAVSAG